MTDPSSDELALFTQSSTLRGKTEPASDDWFWHFRAAEAELQADRSIAAPTKIAALQAMWAIVQGVHRDHEMLGGALAVPLPADRAWLDPLPAPGNADPDDALAGRDMHALVPVPYWAVVALGEVWGQLLAWDRPASEFNLNHEFGAKTGGKQGERGYVATTLTKAQRRRVAAEVEGVISQGMNATKAYLVVANGRGWTPSRVKEAHLAEREWVQERHGGSGG